MWPGGPSKQRLWLGAGQYRDGCRKSATNADATSAYANTYGDAMRAWNTHAYAYSDRDSNYNANCDTDSYTNGNTYSERYTDADTNIYSYAKGDTKASPDTASAADSVGG